MVEDQPLRGGTGKHRTDGRVERLRRAERSTGIGPHRARSRVLRVVAPSRWILVMVATCSIALTSIYTGVASGTDPPSTVPSSVQLAGGFAFTGAEIIGPLPLRVRRHLDAYHAAVFVQSFFPTAVSGRVQHARPPSSARVYRVDVTGSWDGAGTSSTRPVFYASDGAHAWIAAGVPRDTPVARLDFWSAPDRVVSAFEGRARLVPTAGTDNGGPSPSTPPTTFGTTHGAAGGRHSSWPYAGAGIGLGVIALALGLFMRQRRRHDRVVPN